MLSPLAELFQERVCAPVAQRGFVRGGTVAGVRAAPGSAPRASLLRWAPRRHDAENMPNVSTDDETNSFRCMSLIWNLFHVTDILKSKMP